MSTAKATAAGMPEERVMRRYHAHLTSSGRWYVLDVVGDEFVSGAVDANLSRLQADYPNVVVRPARWDGSRENPIVPLEDAGNG